MTNQVKTSQKPNKGKLRYFPHIGGSLVIGAAAVAAFIGSWEGEEQYTVYADKLANGLPTVCKGLTRHITTTPIVIGEKWTPEKCEQEETAAIEKVQLSLVKCFKRLPPQSVFNAATSHAWNFGSPSTCGSAAMSAWNQGNWALGCERISNADDGTPVWSYVKTGRLLPNGKPELKFVRGLANRREAETKFCLEDIK